MSASPNIAPLSYSPADPARRRRRRLVRRTTWLTLALATLAAGWFLVLPAVAHYRLRAAERACMEFTMPAGQVVCEEDPVKAAKLRAADGAYEAGPGNSARRVPAAWRHYYQMLAGAPLDSDGTAFVGRVVSKGGTVRLVAVDVERPQSPAGLYGLRVTTIAPVAAHIWAHGLKPLPSSHVSFWTGPCSEFCAGRIDPSHPDRFTVQCRDARYHFVVTFLLRDDGQADVEDMDVEPRPAAESRVQVEDVNRN